MAPRKKKVENEDLDDSVEMPREEKAFEEIIETNLGIIEAISAFKLDRFRAFAAKKKFNSKVLSHSEWAKLFSKHRII